MIDQAKNIYKRSNKALTGVPQWAGHHSANQKVASLISHRDTCLGCGPGPWLGHMGEATD